MAVGGGGGRLPFDDTVSASSDADAASDATTNDARRPGQPFFLRPGARLGRYVIESRLGAGGMGVVWAARDPDLGRRVALKLVAVPVGGAGARLLREAQAMARVSHPNVVAVYDVGRLDDEVFIAMELIEGKTLSNWLRERRRPWREVLDAFVAAGQGLAAAHRAGLVHRDFKPQNVLVGSDGRVRVGDFGLAREDHRAASAEAPLGTPAAGGAATLGGIAGTPMFMAPEQLAGGPIDHHTDQFSFCVALWQALFHAHPFGDPEAPFPELAARMARGVTEPPKGHGVPARLRRVLERGLRAHPAERHADMDALLAALAALRRPRPLLLVGLSLASTVAVVTTLVIVHEDRGGSPGAAAAAPPPAATADAAPRPAPTHTKLTSSGDADDPDLSPDGKTLAYLDHHDLWLRPVAGGEARRVLTGAVDDVLWSPTGQELLVWRDDLPGDPRGLRVIGLDGTIRQRLPPRGNAGWADGGRAVAWITRRERAITVRDLASGAERSLPVPGTYDAVDDLDTAPDRGLFAVTVVAGGATAVLLLDEPGAIARELYRGAPAARYEVAAFDRGGDALWLITEGEPGEVQRLAFDPATFAPRGPPVTVLTGVEVSELVPLGDGRLVYSRHDGIEHLYTARPGAGVVPLTRGTTDHDQPALSPDGTRVAFVLDRRELHVMPSAGGDSTRLAFAPRPAAVAWAPDGKTLAVTTLEHELWLVPLEGGEPRRLVEGVDYDVAWAPAARPLVQRVGIADFDWVDPETGARTALLGPGDHGRLYDPAIAPGGTHVALRIHRDDVRGVFLVPAAPDPEDPPRRLGDAGDPLVFAADGSWLLVATDGARTDVLLDRLPIRPGRGRPTRWLALQHQGGWLDEATASPAGDLAVLSLVTRTSDLWIAGGL